MSTPSVPGADAKNLDKLDIGCWAEDAAGETLIFVQGFETGNVVYEMYDLAHDPPYVFNDSMTEKDFKDFFSFPPVGKSDVKWTWHDKTGFPWQRVMRRLDKPLPRPADVQDQLTLAQQVAKKLGLRARHLDKEDVTPQTEDRRRRGYAIMDRIAETIGELTE